MVALFFSLDWLRPLHDINIATLRAGLGVVNQEPKLFSTTVYSERESLHVDAATTSREGGVCTPVHQAVWYSRVVKNFEVGFVAADVRR